MDSPELAAARRDEPNRWSSTPRPGLPRPWHRYGAKTGPEPTAGRAPADPPPGARRVGPVNVLHPDPARAGRWIVFFEPDPADPAGKRGQPWAQRESDLHAEPPDPASRQSLR